MWKKTTLLFCLFVPVSLCLCTVVFALCFEAIGGKLQSGSIGEYIPRILESYENDVPNGAVYTIQKKNGFYFKVCDESNQVKKFMEKWVFPTVTVGNWEPILTTPERLEIKIIKNYGIYKIKKENGSWIVWTYSNHSDNRIKRETSTEIENARKIKVR